MPLEFAELPQSNSTGADPATVVAIIEALRENPERRDVRFADDSFSPQKDDKKGAARGRASSAGDRMRKAVAAALGIEETALSSKVRATDHDAKGQPLRFAYWITAKDAAGLEVLKSALPPVAAVQEGSLGVDDSNEDQTTEDDTEQDS